MYIFSITTRNMKSETVTYPWNVPSKLDGTMLDRINRCVEIDAAGCIIVQNSSVEFVDEFNDNYHLLEFFFKYSPYNLKLLAAFYSEKLVMPEAQKVTHALESFDSIFDLQVSTIPIIKEYGELFQSIIDFYVKNRIPLTPRKDKANVPDGFTYALEPADVYVDAQIVEEFVKNLREKKLLPQARDV